MMVLYDTDYLKINLECWKNGEKIDIWREFVFIDFIFYYSPQYLCDIKIRTYMYSINYKGRHPSQVKEMEGDRIQKNIG